MQPSPNQVIAANGDKPAVEAGTSANGDQLEIRNIPTNKIRRMPDQPRIWINPLKLKELAESIAAVGQAQAGRVQPLNPPQGEIEYELISGERRWRACELAGKPFRAEIDNTPMDPTEIFEKALTCNSDQESLTPTEYALAIQRLKAAGRSDEQIAKVISQTVGFVRRHYSLLNLEASVFKLLGPEVPEDKRLIISTALELIHVPQDYQGPLAKEIIDRGLTLVQAKHLIRMTLQGRGERSKRRPSREFAVFAKFLQRTEEQLQIFLATPGPTMRAILCTELQERMKVYELLERVAEDFPDLKQEVKKALALTETERVRERQKAMENLKALAEGFPKLRDLIEKVLAAPTADQPGS